MPTIGTTGRKGRPGDASGGTAMIDDITGRGTTGDPEKQTSVLVHGAYADSSSWNGSVNALRRAGHPVIAVANPLRGIESDAEYLRSVLDRIDGPIVIAGHSYGGVVM